MNIFSCEFIRMKKIPVLVFMFMNKFFIRYKHTNYKKKKFEVRSVDSVK